MKIKTEYPFYFFTISILIFLVAPVLLANGMFMDGLQYACVSKNLYHGEGTFWKPFLSHVWFMNGSQSFMEHPPLFYWLESRMFFVTGDSIYAERFFSLLMLGLNAWLIHKLWCFIFRDNTNLKGLSWLPVLLWITTPICFWTFQNNMIEMLVSVFTLSSVYFAFRSIQGSSKYFLWIALSSLCLCLAFLTKGIVTLFPLCVYLLFFVTHSSKKSLKRMLLGSVMLVAIVVILFSILFLISEEALESIKFYLTERLVNRLQDTPTTDNRWWLLIDLVGELIPMLCFSTLIHLATFKKKLENRYVRTALLFLLLGALGSLPLLFSLVQKKFYFMPSIAFYAIGFSILISKNIELLIGKFLASAIRRKIILVGSITLLVSSLVFSFSRISKYSRDEELIKEVGIIGNYLKRDAIISTDNPTYNSWSFQFYLNRNYNINIDPNPDRSPYFVTNRKVNEYFKIRYSKVNLPTKEYHLYILKYFSN